MLSPLKFVLTLNLNPSRVVRLEDWHVRPLRSVHVHPAGFGVKGADFLIGLDGSIRDVDTVTDIDVGDNLLQPRLQVR